MRTLRWPRLGDLPRPCAEPRLHGIVVVVKDDETCYVIFRRDRRKKLPLFASIFYVEQPGACFVTLRAHVYRHLLLHHRDPVHLERTPRGRDRGPSWSIMLKSPRPKMYRSPTLRPDQIDYLYSELTCVAW